jgi:hypothetical protein
MKNVQISENKNVVVPHASDSRQITHNRKHHVKDIGFQKGVPSKGHLLAKKGTSPGRGDVLATRPKFKVSQVSHLTLGTTTTPALIIICSRLHLSNNLDHKVN